jgi:O-antigen/teichoic acid export membrane protein
VTVGVRARGFALPSRGQFVAFVSLSAATQGEAVLSFLGTVALVRLAGAHGAGQVFLAQSFAAVWFLVWDPRLDDAAQRYVPIVQRDRAGWGTALFLRLLYFDGGLGVVTGLAGAGLAVLAGACGWVGHGQVVLTVLAMAGGGLAAASGTAGAGFALAGRLRRLGAFRRVLAGTAAASTVAATVLCGPVGYLAAAAAGQLLASVVLSVAARRAMAGSLGAPVPGVRWPPGILRFAVCSSLATSVSVGGEAGVLSLAGILGGPTLVTYLKVAAAPGRLFASVVGPLAAQLYPRLTVASAAGDLGVVRRDVFRATAALAVLGATGLAAAVPLAGPALSLVYGHPYAVLATVTAVLFAAACLRGAVVWAKVLPLALGRPGLRLGFVAAEAALLSGALVVAARVASGPHAVALGYAFGNAAVAAAGLAAWLALARSLRSDKLSISV